MEELISYRHSNRLKLCMWLGAAVMVAFIYAYQSASANPSDSYIVRIVPIGILAFFWVFFLRRAGIDKLADEVRDLGDRLQIRRGPVGSRCSGRHLDGTQARSSCHESAGSSRRGTLAG
jgi:hypothetical protein